MQTLYPKRALLSVSDKTGLIELAHALHKQGIVIISTGGTATHLQHADIPLIPIEQVTGFPEMMQGRVKTLHPAIFAGILGKRDEHQQQAKQQAIEWIDIVVCNLYPFAQTIADPNASFADAIEHIDVGGPSLLRAAAKNMAWTTVVVDPQDYQPFITELSTGISVDTRQRLAAKAFAHTASYDHLIHQYLSVETEAFPQHLSLQFTKSIDLRYGENPDQQAAAYVDANADQHGILQAQQHQGKVLSYNNILDAEAAWTSVAAFSAPTCVVVKHNNPCGVATASDIDQAFQQAWQADSLSAFGGIVALNRTCTEPIAEFLCSVFIEVVIAPDYTAEALTLFATKPNLRILQLPLKSHGQRLSLQSIDGGLLLQTAMNMASDYPSWQCVSQTAVNEQQLLDLQFAWQVVKSVKSNAIVIANNQITQGIGCGHVSRIDAVISAIDKAKTVIDGDAVLASDAFFPFRDSIDAIVQAGIGAIVQPGGSVRDQEVIAACNEAGITLLFTGNRCFKH